MGQSLARGIVNMTRGAGRDPKDRGASIPVTESTALKPKVFSSYDSNGVPLQSNSEGSFNANTPPTIFTLS